MSLKQTTIPAAIGEAFEGGTYAGIIRGADGGPDAHVILLPGDISANWDAAVEFATAAGGELPTRREQALLFANLPEQFEEDWYWSGEQHAANPSCAWTQGFNGGYQGNDLKSGSGRARAVRRFPI